MTLSIAPPADALLDLLAGARERQREELQSGGFGGQHIINDVAIQPGTGDIWIAPGAPGLFRFSRARGSFALVKVVDKLTGMSFGFQDIEFAAERGLFGVSGKFCVRAEF